MIKNVLATALVSVALLGAAAPAFAATYDVTANEQSYDFDNALAVLQSSGVKAESVEIWGDVVRAYVTLDNGTQAMQFFDKDTLTPVTL
jgi:hypothetical protein